MCSSKTKLQRSTSDNSYDINGRQVLQPAGNTRLSLLERRNSLKKTTNTTTTTILTTTISPISPKLKSPRPPAIKRSGDGSGNDPNSLNTNVVQKVPTTPPGRMMPVTAMLKKPKMEVPGSIAAARREQVAIMQVERKMKIAHYGRSKSAKYDAKVVPIDSSSPTLLPFATIVQEKRCSFITSNSDPIYVAYHDEEWGVPAHDDKLLFELLVLTGAQVGSDWTSVLKKRQAFRDAFSGFDAEIVSKYNEKKILSISGEYGIELSQVRGVVDNANRVLQMKKEFGSFDKYLWKFVNDKAIVTQYKLSQKIPVKTSKSEAISKDMVKRGFRLVGPTAIHSFMQAAGLTNDHLITCPRHKAASAPPPDNHDHNIISTPI